MPWARDMLGLEPVARREAPSSVPKNQYSTAMTTATKMATTRMGLSRLRDRTLCWSTSRSYCRELTGRLACPMIRRFTEYRASWVRIPARMAGMPQAVWNRPVTSPASTPARKAPSMARGIGAPAMVSMMKVAPPVAMVPSTVRSATSRIRNVIYTPMAMMPQMSPWAATPGRALTRCMMFK